jgi:nascent polypeptide-associated complex subunit alpha
MFGGVNPKQMQGMMRKMGIAQEQIDAARVIIEKNDGTKTVIENPSVMKIKMQGDSSYQISGDEVEEETSTEEIGISEEDIKMVMEKTGATEEQAKESLEKTDDLTESILELSE